MVVSFAKFWKNALFPERWINKLALVDGQDSTNEQFLQNVLMLFPAEGDSVIPVPPSDGYEPTEPVATPTGERDDPEPRPPPEPLPTSTTRRSLSCISWTSFHSEPCSDFRCSASDSVKMGGSSSGQVPPASTAAMPQAWQMVLMDVAEVAFYRPQKKVKFLLIMDAATKFKVVVPLSRSTATRSSTTKVEKRSSQISPGFGVLISLSLLWWFRTMPIP